MTGKDFWSFKCVQWITNSKSASVPNTCCLANCNSQNRTHPQQQIIIDVVFIIQLIYLFKQKQQTKQMDTHFLFRVIYYSFKQKFSTNH